MKFTAQRGAAIRDIEPGEVFANDDGRWVVDEARRTLAGIGLYCKAEGSTSGRRTLIEFKDLDEVIQVEAGVEDGAELLTMLDKLLSGSPPVDGPWHHFDQKAGRLEIMLGTRVVGKVAGRVWSISIEA